MQFDTDLGKIESKEMGGFLPIGTYECKCTKVSFHRTAGKKTLYLKIEWESIGGEGTTTEKKWITEASLPYLKGWSEGVMNVKFTGTLLNEKLYVGRHAKVQVQDKGEYEGKAMTESISSFSEDNGGRNKPVEGSTGASKEKADDVKVDVSKNSGDADSGSGYNNDSPPDSCYEGAAGGSNKSDDLPF